MSKSKDTAQLTMFTHEDLPLFSGTAPTSKADVFMPEAAHRQESLAECPTCLDTGTVDGKPCWCKADAERVTVQRGDQFHCTLPPWINEGRTVIITVTKVLAPFGRDSYNGHDVMGNWKDKDGKIKRGKFYLKDLTPV